MYDFFIKNLNEINVTLFCGFLLMFVNDIKPVIIKRIKRLLLKKIIIKEI